MDVSYSTSSFRTEYTSRASGYRTPPPPDVEPISPVLAATTAPLLSHTDGKKNNRKRKVDQAQLQNVAKPMRVAQHDQYHSHGHDHRPYAPSEDHYLRNPNLSHRHSPSALDLFASVVTSPLVAQSNLSLPAMRKNVPVTVHNQPQFEHADTIQSRNALQPTTHAGARSHLNAISRPFTSYMPQTSCEHRSPYDYSTYHAPLSGNLNIVHPITSSSQLTNDNLQDAELLLGFALGSNFRPTLPAFSITQQHNTSMGEHLSSLPVESVVRSVDSDRTTGMGSTQDRNREEPLQNNSDSGRPTNPHSEVDVVKQQLPLANPSCISTSEQETRVNTSYKPVPNYAGTRKVKSELPLTEVPPPAKTRVHKGWPKGKPRGTKSTTAQSKSQKKATPMQNPYDPPMKIPQKGQRYHDIKHTSSSEIKIVYKEHNTHMELSTNTMLTLPITAEYATNPLEVDRPLPDIPLLEHKSSSLPAKDTLLNSRTEKLPQAGQLAPKPQFVPEKEESQTNLCDACKSSSTKNGFHELWITCNGCKFWFHTACVGFENERKVRDVDKFYCEPCGASGNKTTYVRKSSRAHVSVDYAGLNEGKVRTATDTVEHHYIQAFKDGTIELQPETFPRMRPEFVTAEFFERSGTMSEPVLIPAEWNPRPVPPVQPNDPEDFLETDAVGEQEWFSEAIEYDCVPDDGQDKLGMVMPHGLTVRKVAELVGPDERVEVIDVKSQEGGDNRWNLRKWADYYEAEGEKPVRNVISLEVSQTKLGKLIRRPQIVRDLDLQDAVWPQDELAKGNYPQVQFYCLMSVEDCYTDFHIDFGGSSVYYHILKGQKTFFFIPPKKQHLKAYEQWCLSSNQGSTFLGDLTKECYRVDLFEQDTMLIPSGWIHAVWTPANSLVIGGNFLTRMHYGMQISVNDIEKSTGVGRRFRYPHFQKVLWYTIIQYLQEDPVPSTVADNIYNGGTFYRPDPVFHDFGRGDGTPEYFNSRYYSRGEIEGLGDLMRFVFRTVLISLGKVQGLAKTTQEAVVRSLPKGYGEHLDLLKTFALWVAWKRGNETLPVWAHPDSPASDMELITAEKKTKTDREALGSIAPERRSQRQPAQKEKNNLTGFESRFSEHEAGVKTTTCPGSSKSAPGPRRIACEACRKRRIRCKHKEADELVSRQAQRFGIKTIDDEPTTEPFALPRHTPSHPSASIVNIVPAKQDSRASDPLSLATPASVPSKAKACDECRRSKRRCIHDENGNVDPTRASQTPIPRAFSQKRARQDNTVLLASKKIKLDVDLEHTLDLEAGAISDMDAIPQFYSEHDRSVLNQGMPVEYDTCQSPIDYVDSDGLGGQSRSLFHRSHIISNTPRMTSDETNTMLSTTDQQIGDNVLGDSTHLVATQSPCSNADSGQGRPTISTSGLAGMPTARSAQLELEQHSRAATRSKSEQFMPEDSRSRTSSLHVLTNSTASVGASGSVPSSPLTDVGSSSPARQVFDGLTTRKLVIPKKESAEVPCNPDSKTFHVSSGAVPSTSEDGWKRPVTTTPAREIREENRRQSRGSGSRSVSRASSVAQRKARSAGYSRLSASVDTEEEESLRLAWELQDQEFGLRRRSK